MSDRWQISGTRTSGCAAVGMALFYIVLAYLSRYYSLDEYNDSWDEATYILLGRGWLQGETLYVDIWDTKPPGIVWISALVQVLFDNAVNGLRWLSMLSIGGTAYCIHRIGQHLFPKEPQLGVWAGIFYVFSISYVTFGFSLGRGTGMETNTEMFFIFFTCWGILRWLGDPEKLGRAFQGGLLLGIAFLIKYFVLFDMLAAGLLVVMLFWARYPQDRKQWFQRVVQHGGLMALGAVLPFGLLWGYYYFLSGNYDAFHEVTFEVGSRYSSPIKLRDFFSFWGDFFYLGGLVSLGFAVVLFRFFQGRLWRSQPPLVWVLLWFAILITGISLPGKYFAHYGYQVFPPFALFAAAMFTRFVLPGDVFRARVVRGAAIFLVITLPVTNYLKQKHHFDEPDHAKMIADYLNAKQEEGLTIYLDGYKHIIYYLTESPVLTRYVHPSLMYKSDHIKAIGLDVIGETTKIMQQRPRYILYREAPTNYLIQHHLENDYELEQSFPDDVHLFRIKDHGK